MIIALHTPEALAGDYFSMAGAIFAGARFASSKAQRADKMTNNPQNNPQIELQGISGGAGDLTISQPLKFTDDKSGQGITLLILSMDGGGGVVILHEISGR